MCLIVKANVEDVGARPLEKVFDGACDKYGREMRRAFEPSDTDSPLDTWKCEVLSERMCERCGTMGSANQFQSEAPVCKDRSSQPGEGQRGPAQPCKK